MGQQRESSCRLLFVAKYSPLATSTAANSLLTDTKQVFSVFGKMQNSPRRLPRALNEMLLSNEGHLTII